MPIVRLLRPELAAIPHTFGDAAGSPAVLEHVLAAGAIHPSAADVAVEEFLRVYRSVNARVAFHASARHIYLEEPNGPHGFYTRLPALEPPAMFVWGDEDPLVPHAFSRYVREALPDARQVVLEQCGHVPQVEHPVDANALVHDFIGHAQASARGAGSQADRPGGPTPAGPDERQRPSERRMAATARTRADAADAADAPRTGTDLESAGHGRERCRHRCPEREGQSQNGADPGDRAPAASGVHPCCGGSSTRCRAG